MIGMKVCSIMMDRDGGQGQPWDERAQQDVVGQQIALPRDIRAKRGGKSGRSSTQQLHSRGIQGRTMCLDAGSPDETLSGLVPYPGCTGRKWLVFIAKRRRSCGQKAALSGVQRAKYPYFAHSKADLGGIQQGNSR